MKQEAGSRKQAWAERGRVIAYIPNCGTYAPPAGKYSCP